MISPFSRADTLGSPRIPPVRYPDQYQNEVLAKTPSRLDGRPFNVFLTLVHHPRLLKRFNVLAGAFQAGILDAADRELVILRVAARCGSQYEFEQHAPMGVEVGLVDKDIEYLRKGLICPEWDQRQQALIAFTDNLIDNDAVDDETWHAVPFYEDYPSMLELTCLIGFYRMAALVMNTARIEFDGFAANT